MLISHRKQFIYTKTAKTAGTSVEVYFEKYCMPEGAWEFSHSHDEYVSAEGIIGYRGKHSWGKKWRNHMSALKIKNNIGNSIWDKYYKFCVIRNPFDKLVSGFYMQEKRIKNYGKKKRISSVSIPTSLTPAANVDTISGRLWSSPDVRIKSSCTYRQWHRTIVSLFRLRG